jgi:prepilin-type N-terminal cleavage/methylation domain-containing protein
MLKENDTNGFTLIECVIAMVLTLIGLSAVLSLLAFCLRTEVFSRELATANSLARLKIEELANSPRTSGGSLTTNSTGYFDNPNTRYIRRWQISNDPVGTQTVVVVMMPNASETALSEVRLTTKMK